MIENGVICCSTNVARFFTFAGKKLKVTDGRTNEEKFCWGLTTILNHFQSMENAVSCSTNVARFLHSNFSRWEKVESD